MSETLLQVPNSYDAWDAAHHEWRTATAFLNAPGWADGIHTINLTGGPALDILVQGNPFTSAVVPVFFNGAITNRDTKTGPFFSGQGIATSGGFGFIAISDPSIYLNDSLSLAWYAGNRHCDFQKELTFILEGIAKKSCSELLLIGGSGGGFAALYYGGRLGELASVIAWNPQTDILRYNKTFVQNYLSPAFDLDFPVQDGWESVARDALPATALTALESRPRRLLYMQNATDWHVQSHAVPFLANGYKHVGRGIFEADDNHVVCIADYGDGHAPLPESIVLAAVTYLKTPAITAAAAVDRLAARNSIGWRKLDDPAPALAELLGEDKRVCILRQ